MSDDVPPAPPAVFRARMRAYFGRVLLLLVAAPVALYALFAVLRRVGVASDAVGAVVGILALVGVVGGSLAVHAATVRCPKCERWLVPGGVNGFAPSACPHCHTGLS